MDSSKFKIILLTVLTLSVLTIAIVELTGISDHSLAWYRDRRNGQATLYDRANNRTYRGDIYPEQEKTRDELVHEMPKTTMQFYETKYSFGEVGQNKEVKHTFHFKNTGQNPLMIAKTDVTCGCTVTDFPEDPIAPGQEGDLTVTFNTRGKNPGYYENPVTVHSNAMPEAVTIKTDADVK